MTGLLCGSASGFGLDVAPVIAPTISSRVASRWRRRSPASRPSRRTKMRSATSKTSARLWLMTTTPSPRSRRRLTRSSTCAVWRTPSAAVGSSRITTFGSPSSERAMATCWRWPPDIAPTSARTLVIVTARFSSSSWERCSMSISSSWRTTPRRRRRRSPRGRGRGSRRRRGCRTARGPGRRSRSRASWRRAGEVIFTGCPSKRICPSSISWMPAIALTSVDLPAPLSPTSATTSPAWTSKSTSVSASTGPKLLLTPSSASSAPLLSSCRVLSPR